MVGFPATLLRLLHGKPKFSSVMAFIFLLSSLGACGTMPPVQVDGTDPIPAPKSATVITLGRVSEEPTERIKEWTPLVNYLANNLGDFEIKTGEVKIAGDMATMSQWMQTGEVDLFIDSFYSTMVVADQSGATPILFRHKGQPDNHAVFFTQTGSGLSALDDLQGKTIALDDAESATGFMLPVAYLLEEGLYPIEKADAVDLVSPQEVGYVFAGEDEAALRWVADGRLLAGAADYEAFQEFAEKNPGVLSAIAETEPLFRDQLLMASPTLNEQMRVAIKSVLIDMPNTPEGRAILKELKSSTFNEFLGDRENALARAEELYRLVTDHLQMIGTEG